MNMKGMMPLSSRLSQLFEDSLLSDWVEGGQSGWYAPLANVWESAEDYQISLDLPGVTLSDLGVEFKDGQLRIEGERKVEQEQKDRKLHRVERRYGKFLRTFSLPRDVDAEKIEASYKDGVLEVRVPKKPEARVRKIEIRN